MKSVDQDVGTVANLGSTEGSRSGMNVSSKALDSRGKRACLSTFSIVWIYGTSTKFGKGLHTIVATTYTY